MCIQTLEQSLERLLLPPETYAGLVPNLSWLVDDLTSDGRECVGEDVRRSMRSDGWRKLGLGDCSLQGVTEAIARFFPRLIILAGIPDDTESSVVADPPPFDHQQEELVS